jgi:hypothetical protein
MPDLGLVPQDPATSLRPRGLPDLASQDPTGSLIPRGLPDLAGRANLVGLCDLVGQSDLDPARHADLVEISDLPKMTEFRTKAPKAVAFEVPHQRGARNLT